MDDHMLPPPTRRELVVTISVMAAFLVALHFVLPLVL